MKPRLLVLDLWGVGDLALATPFLRQACQKYEVTLFAKPLAEQLHARFWPDAQIIPFMAPWAVFRGKYRLHEWPWRLLGRTLQTIRRQHFDAAVSARRDPRDHLLMFLSGAKRRYGFPRLGSQMLLTDAVKSREPLVHRYSHWQQLAKALGFELSSRNLVTSDTEHHEVLIHTGASQPVKVWPLERYSRLVRRLRQQGYKVKVICDADQLQYWLDQGEEVAVPQSLTELCDRLDSAAIFIGNDSGPGHVAAVSGVPTFTIFGNQSPAMFAPIHPSSEWVEGAPCQYKPCYDYCHFPAPYCLLDIDEETVCRRIELFAAKHMPIQTQRPVFQNR